MKLIQYKTKGNIIKVPGTNEAGDWIINLLCFPFFGYHFGCFLAAMFVYRKIKKQFPDGSHLIIKAHSMAGGVFQIVSSWLVSRNSFNIHLELQGSYKVLGWFRGRPYGLTVKNRVYGNDPIPALFPWFHNIDIVQHEGPERTAKGIFKQLFKMRKGDHLEY